MYLYHFGFKELPFGLTPDTSFFCDLPIHVEAFNVLSVAIATGEGFVKIIGEVGTGKTLLCRQVLNHMEKAHRIAYFPNPYLTPEALRFSLASELGMRVNKDLDQATLTEKISRKLIQLNQQGKPVLLLVDEAQALPDESLEALRLFTNLETEKRKLLQVVLFAQPELDTRLAKPHLRQLRQRITFSYQLTPLTLEQTKRYVMHRIQAAAMDKHQASHLQLSPWAWRLLHKTSRGIPRLINILTHKALMLVYGENAMKIRRKHIVLAAKDTDDVQPFFSWLQFSFWTPLMIVSFYLSQYDWGIL
ncbi:MAG: AAA family ATPase [Gammaproteobacteria bacterium CG22_combo_CG10-13_8_21_14_all_40_8]|nr:MAG: AAA family ATPase [Gammaproteobacteria bacterium CG22_combo_CG10-13_8_21_14_all_40_8]